jgi:hypothetical protein
MLSLRGDTLVAMPNSEAVSANDSTELKSRNALSQVSRGHDSTEGQQALREWNIRAEGLRARIQAVRLGLQQARPNNRSIGQAVDGKLTASVRGVIEAAKREGERILLAAQQQAQAGLAAAREEAGEIVAAGRREGSATVAAAHEESVRIVTRAEEEEKWRLAQAKDVAMGVRMEAERLVQRLEDTIGGPISDEPKVPPPALSEGTGNGTLPGPPGLEGIDRQLIDRLWEESLGRDRTVP